MKKFISAILLSLFLIPSFAYAQTKNPLSGSKLRVDIEEQSAFPDGKDCVHANFEALNKDGDFLENEPLIFSMSQSVKITDSNKNVTSTGSGNEYWCVTSTKATRSQITVKLANYPTIRKTFSVNFKVNRNISDKTERSLFERKTPITFTAKIDPSLVNGLKTAELHYKYTRRYNTWGFWKTRKEDVKLKLKCDNEGYCSATLTGDHTKSSHNQSGNFTYTFKFVDSNGTTSQRTYSGRLK